MIAGGSATGAVSRSKRSGFALYISMQPLFRAIVGYFCFLTVSRKYLTVSIVNIWKLNNQNNAIADYDVQWPDAGILENFGIPHALEDTQVKLVEFVRKAHARMGNHFILPCQKIRSVKYLTFIDKFEVRSDDRLHRTIYCCACWIDQFGTALFPFLFRKTLRVQHLEAVDSDKKWNESIL